MIAGMRRHRHGADPGHARLRSSWSAASLILLAQRIKARTRGAEAAAKAAADGGAAGAAAGDHRGADRADARARAGDPARARPGRPRLRRLRRPAGRVRALRRKIAMELGVVVPPVRTRDSVDLPPSTYVDPHRRRGGGPRHRARRESAGAGRAAGLAAGHRRRSSRCSGWRASGFRRRCGTAPRWPAPRSLTASRCSSRTSPSIVTDNAARLLTREDVRVLTEGVKQLNPSAVDELIPGAAHAWRRCSGCCRACSPSRCPSTTWPASTRR